jgi:tetratricopeptide (TPR) repeat protein
MMSSSSRHLGSFSSSSAANNSYNYNRRRRRNSFSSATETSIKSLGTIDLNHSNSLLDDGDEEGLGLYAYDDIEKFHNCGGSSLSLLLLASSSLSSSSSSSRDGVVESSNNDDNDDDDLDGTIQQTIVHGQQYLSVPEENIAVMQQQGNDVVTPAIVMTTVEKETRVVQHQQGGVGSGDSHPFKEQQSMEYPGDCSGGKIDNEMESKQTLFDGNVDVMESDSKKESLYKEQVLIDHADPNDNSNNPRLSSTKINASSALLLSEKEMLYHQLSDLYEEGKKQLESGVYEKAWDIQRNSLSLISSYRTSTLNVMTTMHNMEHVWEAELESFCARQEATIRYELAKIKYLHARETIHDHNDDVRYQMHLSRLDDLVENARCKVALCNYEYYTAQLRAVEESQDRSDTNQIYNKLYILHNLGSLCEKDLHRYDEALVFYRHALDIEERVLRVYRDHIPDGVEVGGIEQNHNDDDDIATEVDFHVNDFVQRIRCTKRKIGRIQHTGLGRFDLALLSSVST